MRGKEGRGRESQRTKTSAFRDLFEAPCNRDLTAVTGAGEYKEDVKDGAGFSGTVTGTHCLPPAFVRHVPKLHKQQRNWSKNLSKT